MTWAIGAANRLGGYAVLISDVQVTFADGSSADILRKAYPVGPYLLGAFAGSVTIGFRLLESAAHFLRVPADAPHNLCWQPPYVAEHWSPIARSVFEDATREERELGSQFLLVGPHPTEDGIPGRAIPYICRFSWPEFSPEITRNGDSAVSIGSGDGVAEYTAALHECLEGGLWQAEIDNTGGWGSMLGFAVNHTLERHRVAGISTHVHIQAAFRGEFRFATSDRTDYLPDGSKREVQMPRVANNYQELLDLAREVRADIETARC